MLNFLNNFAGFTRCSLGNSQINSGIMTFGIIVHIVLLAVIFSDQKPEGKATKAAIQARNQWKKQKGSVVGGIFALIGIAMTHDGGIDYCEQNISWLPFLGFFIVYVLLFSMSFSTSKPKK